MDEPTTPGLPASTSGSAGGGAKASYREVTISSIVFGVIAGAIMNAAITYAGLKIGFTIVGSSIAAVLGFGVLRGALRKGSILEVNIGQTIASAVNTPNSGVIFTVPVLLLLGFELSVHSVEFWLITAACVAGAVLGCAFIIPLRKQMLDIERLRFPSGTAVAAILKSPGAGPAKAILLVLGVVVAAVMVAPKELPALLKPADTVALTDLVQRERITRGQMLLTKEIAGWIETQAAPAEVIAHGKAIVALEEARDAFNKTKDESAKSEAKAKVDALEQDVKFANEVGQHAILTKVEDPQDRSRVPAYPPELAKRAYLASAENSGEKLPWTSLKSIKTGWASIPYIGYGDLEIRMTPEYEGAPEGNPSEAAAAIEALDAQLAELTPKYEAAAAAHKTFVDVYLAPPSDPLTDAERARFDELSARSGLMLAEDQEELDGLLAKRLDAVRNPTASLPEAERAERVRVLELVPNYPELKAQYERLTFDRDKASLLTDVIDFEADGVDHEQAQVLTRRVDRDRNGVPDQLITDSTVDVGRWLGLPEEMQLVFAIAPFALGAGYLTGRAGLFVLAGGVLAYLVINPMLFKMGWAPASMHADEVPGWAYAQINRPLGIGLLLGGAMMGVIASLPAIKAAFKSIGGPKGASSGGRDELGLGVLLIAVIVSLGLLYVAADKTGERPINNICPVTHQHIDAAHETQFETTYDGYVIAFASDEALQAFEKADDAQQAQVAKQLNASRPGLLARAKLSPHLRAAIIAIVGALWIWFAGIIIAQCTGMTDWSPISGMALLTVVLVMVLGGPGGVTAAVLIGAALCVAITVASDMMSDLKTGYLVGASPKRQQTVEMILSGLGPVICMLVLLIIVEANKAKYGIAMGPGTDTTAPQAQALQAVITGVQGGAMPYALYGTGALLGGLLGLGAFSGLGVLIGLSMYLPMVYIATYGIGCVINMIVGAIFGRRNAEEWGVPVAAGFIVGDALLALGVNLLVLWQQA
ncbi:MAG: OPT/YSL family transporter [Phycisphaerales bacterium]|nr:OPT/YSL family transporter [Phycisphaerales bacterium]